jgi:O-antigen/teichoic acid export membrane protein
MDAVSRPRVQASEPISTDPPELASEAEGLSSSEVRAKAAASVVTVAARNVTVRVLGLAGNIVLARLLVPSDFGLVSLGLTVTMLGSLLANAGFGPTLVRRERPPSRHELGAVLGFQLAVTIGVVAVVAAVALAVGGSGPVIALMVLALPIDALRIPTGIVAERRLDFHVTARAEVVEMVAYNLAAIGLVVAGLGVYGVALAVIVRALSGSGLLLASGPVGPQRPRWSWPLVREIWRFGVKFQLNSFVTVARDQGVNVVAASIGGLAVLGVWSLAYRLLQSVLLLFQALWRVSFPAIARLLEAGEEHGPLLRRGVGLAAVAAGLPAVAMAGSAPALVPVLFGPRWDDAIPVLPWGAAALLVSGPVTTACTGYLYAVGRAGAVLRSATAQAVLWVGLTALLIGPLGPEGVGIAMLAGALGLTASQVASLRGSLELRLHRTLGPSLVAAAVGGVLGWEAATALEGDAVALAASLVVAEGAFLALSLLLQRNTVRSLWGIGRRTVGGALRRGYRTR